MLPAHSTRGGGGGGWVSPLAKHGIFAKGCRTLVVKVMFSKYFHSDPWLLLRPAPFVQGIGALGQMPPLIPSRYGPESNTRVVQLTINKMKVICCA